MHSLKYDWGTLSSSIFFFSIVLTDRKRRLAGGTMEDNILNRMTAQCSSRLTRSQIICTTIIHHPLLFWLFVFGIFQSITFQNRKALISNTVERQY